MKDSFSAIKRMKSKGAGYLDNFAPSFLKSLGPLDLQELLSINLLVKLDSSVSPVSLHPVFLNYWGECLLIVFTTSLKQNVIQSIPSHILLKLDL